MSKSININESNKGKKGNSQAHIGRKEESRERKEIVQLVFGRDGFCARRKAN